MFGLFKKEDTTIVTLLQRVEHSRQKVPIEVKQISDSLFDQLTNTVKTKWSPEHITNYKAQILSGESHEAFIYNFIIHASGDKLESGKYHVYRGVLNSDGILYRQLFEHAIDTMVMAGEYTKEWADKNLRAPVYKNVGEMG